MRASVGLGLLLGCMLLVQHCSAAPAQPDNKVDAKCPECVTKVEADKLQNQDRKRESELENDDPQDDFATKDLVEMDQAANALATQKDKDARESYNEDVDYHNDDDHGGDEIIGNNAYEAAMNSPNSEPAPAAAPAPAPAAKVEPPSFTIGVGQAPSILPAFSVQPPVVAPMIVTPSQSSDATPTATSGMNFKSLKQRLSAQGRQGPQQQTPPGQDMKPVPEGATTATQQQQTQTPAQQQQQAPAATATATAVPPRQQAPGVTVSATPVTYTTSTVTTATANNGVANTNMDQAFTTLQIQLSPNSASGGKTADGSITVQSPSIMTPGSPFIVPGGALTGGQGVQAALVLPDLQSLQATQMQTMQALAAQQRMGMFPGAGMPGNFPPAAGMYGGVPGMMAPMGGAGAGMGMGMPMGGMGMGMGGMGFGGAPMMGMGGAPMMGIPVAGFGGMPMMGQNGRGIRRMRRRRVRRCGCGGGSSSAQVQPGGADNSRTINRLLNIIERQSMQSCPCASDASQAAQEAPAAAPQQQGNGKSGAQNDWWLKHHDVDDFYYGWDNDYIPRTTAERLALKMAHDAKIDAEVKSQAMKTDADD